MTNMFCESAFFGVVISLLAYELGMLLKKKFGLPIFNPLLISIAVVIVFLAVFDIDYQNYNDGAKYLSYLLTPATVCLAIPLYEQMEALKKNIKAILAGILSGVLTSLTVVLALALSVAAVQPQLQAYVEEDGMACGVGISPHLTNVEYLIPDSYPTRTGNREYAASEGVSVTNETKRGSTVTADVDAKQDGTLLLPLFGYDGYRAQVDGQNVEVALNQAQNNRLEIHLSAGTRGTLRVRFAGKTWWRLTDAVSLLTLIGLFMGRRKEACLTR